MTIKAYIESETAGRQDQWTEAPPVAASPPRATPSTAPAAKLPKARPAKEQPWSPEAMPTDASKKLDPKYAAERADLLASCAPAIRQHNALNPGKTIAESNLGFEQAWLSDGDMDDNSAEISEQIAGQTRGLNLTESTGLGASRRAGICLYQRRLQQLQGSPLSTGAVDGSLTPLSIGSPANEWKQQGKDAHIIASNGKSAMHCVSLETIASGDSNLSGAVKGRRFVNRCDDKVEIVWCTAGACDNGRGNMWTVHPGKAWPVGEGEVRWAACHGANTAAFVKFSNGLRYYCSAPLEN